MGKQNAANQDYTNQADGWDLTGGTTSRRKFAVTGADVTVSGNGLNTHVFPSTSQTLVGRNSTDILTNKTLTSPVIATPTVSSAVFSPGTSVVDTAPIYLISGVNLATTEAGALEYDGAGLHFTFRDAGSRRCVAVEDYNRPTTNYTTTSGSLQSITGLTIPVDANEVWQFEAHMSVASTSAAGVKFGVGAPTGATVEAQVSGAGADETSNARNERLSALDSPTVAAYTIRNGDGVAHVMGILANGSTAGTLAIKILKVTSGTATIYANSYIKARRVA